MHKSNFITILKRLNPDELKQFGKYLKKRYSAHLLSIDLFKHIKKFYPLFESKELTKTFVLGSVFEMKINSSNQKRISNELYKLSKWLEDFLILQELKIAESGLLRSRLLIDIYRERKIDKLFYKQIKTAQGIIERGPANITRYHEMLQLLHKQYYYEPSEKFKAGSDIVAQMIQLLQSYAHLLGQKYQCEVNSRAQILSQQSNDTTGYIFKHDDLVFNLFEKLSHFTHSPSPDTYHKLKSFFFSEDFYQLDREDQQVIITYLTNYTIHLYKMGDPKGVQEAFQIFTHAVSKSLVSIHEYISESRFHNIVNAACAVKEFDWISGFITRYEKNLPEKWREPAIKLAKARIAFELEQFGDTLDLLLQLKFKDVSYALQARILRIRSYFELGEKYQKPLKSDMKAFLTFLNRNNTLNHDTVKSCKNFLKVLKKLVEYQQNKPPLVLDASLANFKPIVCQTWLIQKILARQ